MNEAWDAPYAFRESFADEEDPPPPDFLAPPDRQLSRDVDPDLILGLTQSYAAEITAFDLLVDGLLDALQLGPAADETLLVVTAPRGFALGEHGCVGSCGDSLFGEIIQVPLLLRFPGGQNALRRCQELVQPADVYATLLDWLQIPVPQDGSGASLLPLVDGGEWQRDCVISIGPEQRAIRTPIWFMQQPKAGGASLYAKPDDRWEVNEVADRCADVVRQLTEVLDEFESGTLATGRARLPCIPEELSRELD